MRKVFVLAAAVAVLLAPAAARAQQVEKMDVPGIRNFARLQTTIACGGATTPQGVAEIKKLGFVADIDLREPTERDANIDEEAAAAKAAGIHFVNVPINGANPDPAMIQKFLAAVTAPENQPAYIHCASGNRAAAMWLIKRIDVDGWDVDRASAEAASLGLTSSRLKTFALDYAAKNKK